MVETASVTCIKYTVAGCLFGNGTCDFLNFNSLTPGFALTPLCGSMLYCRLPNGECDRSAFGKFCQECSFNGYIYKGACVCYAGIYDPANGCKSYFGQVTSSIQENVVASRIDCVPYRSKELGFFADPDTSNYVYGQPNPDGKGIPLSCWGTVYGPEPGVLVESSTQKFYTCNTYCGLDPEKPEDDTCETCAGHGFWNGEYCECDTGYNAEFVGYDYFNMSAYVCSSCWGFRGQNQEGYCAAVYTPDPVDGVFKECGGHGVSYQGGCYCYYNSTSGYWVTAGIGDYFSFTLGNSTMIAEFDHVDSCVACEKGYKMPSCTEIDDYTSPPTVSPVTSVPTGTPTRSPGVLCVSGCPGNYLQGNAFLSLYKITNFTGLLRELTVYNSSLSRQCAALFVNVTVSAGVNYLNLTGVSSQYEVDQVIGAFLCENLVGCIAWTWYSYLAIDVFLYSFFTQVGYPSVVSNAGSGYNCGINLNNNPVI